MNNDPLLLVLYNDILQVSSFGVAHGLGRSESMISDIDLQTSVTTCVLTVSSIADFKHNRATFGPYIEL